MAIDGNRLNLQNIEKTRLHKSAKSLVEKIRAVRFPTQPGKPFGHKTGMQPLQSTYGHAVEVVNWSGRDCDLNWHATVGRFVGGAAGRDQR